MDMEEQMEWKWLAKPKYFKQTLLSATLSTTNLTRTDLVSKPRRGVAKPATNHLSYGTA
jgi:hypothetical protein